MREMSLAGRPGPLFVVGMRAEARLLARGTRVVVGADDLAARLDGSERAFVSFGLCGALDPALRPGDVVIGTEVRFGDERFGADRAWIAALRSVLPDAAVGAFAGSDVIVGSRRDKAVLAAATGAAAVDMESHAVARCAARRGLPLAVVRAVSDAATDILPRAARAGFRRDGTVALPAVLLGLAARPWELPALIRTGRAASAGFDALAKAATALQALATTSISSSQASS